MHVLLVGGAASRRLRLARTFHESSPSGEGPLVALSCGRDEALLAESLRARLLIAAGDRNAIDPLAACARGTLFLDHVEQLSVDSQRLLLAVLRGADAERMWVGRLIAGSGIGWKELVSGERFLRSLLDCLDKVRWVLGPNNSRRR